MDKNYEVVKLPLEYPPVAGDVYVYKGVPIDLTLTGTQMFSAGYKVIIRDNSKVIAIPVIKKFKGTRRKYDWFYCDYDGERIGYYEDIDELKDAIIKYLTLIHGVQLEKEEICVEL